MTTRAATKTRLTLDEFLAQQETKPASEYACGEVTQKPMPTQAHSILRFYLGMLLNPFLSRLGPGRALPEWRCIFGPPGHERAIVPDLTVVLKDRMPSGDARDTPYLRTAPDLAIEILSPGQSIRTFVEKILFYLLHGVRLIWIVDAEAEIVLVLRPGEESTELGVGDQLDGGDVLPGFNLDVGELFAQLRGS